MLENKKQTYEFLPGSSLVALHTEQSFPRLWLFELHSLPSSLPVPNTFHSTAAECLQVSRVPGTTNTHFKMKALEIL